ncbi:MAG: DNA polymerase III subunit alpha, partial [Tropicimonas sp.]
LAEVTELVKSGPLVAKMAGSVAGKQERKSARGNRFAFVQASDPTGSYEMTVFSDTLERAREHLEPGQNIVVTVEATAEAEQLKLLCKGARPIDEASAGPGNGGGGGFRVFMNDSRALVVLESILTRTREAGPVRLRGPIHVALMDPTLPGEVEMEIGPDLPVSPQVRGAVKAVAGVIDVEDLDA